MNETANRWNLPKQTHFVDFENPDPKKAGDCWRCAIAAVLGVPAESVPHFLQQELDSRAGNDWKTMDELTQEWLNQRGFVLVRMTGGWVCFDHLPREKAIPVIKCGPTPRSRKLGQHHAVVYLGDRMVYDPHPEGTGLTFIADQYLIVPFGPTA